MAEAISTVNGTRPQAILHPHGNRGADLIETIRLERLSAAILAPAEQKAEPAPVRELFVPAHHTQRPQTAKAARKKPWTEPKWTRPVSASTMRVHSSQVLNELLLAPGETSEQPSRLPSPVPKSTSYAASSTSVAVAPRRRPQSAYTVAEMRARQRAREQHEAMQERVARKLKDTQMAAAAQQEQEFQRAWEQFNAEQSGPVAEIGEFLRLKDVEKLRRANAHCKHWNEEVFDKIQDQVVHQLRKREAKGTYNTRWRHAQDDYLRVVDKKEHGIFRDIIIPDEYDPTANRDKNIKYRSRTIALKDPLKLELTQHQLEARMVPGSAAALAASASKQASKQGRGDLPVTMWSKMDATPYGHFNRVMSKEEGGKITPGPQSTTGLRVLGDHYSRT